jgi:hypothetical protein
VDIRPTVWIASLPLAAIALWLWSEAVDERASRRGHGAYSTELTGEPPNGPNTPRPGDISARSVQRSDAVVVLGYRNRGERANVVNRFRVRAGIRSIDPDAADSVLVLCGGALGGRTAEARLMQRYARDELCFDGHIALDPTSRSTWENIANAIPLVEHATTIKIVSNAPHAELGRQILRKQRPDLADRLVRGAEHRFGEAPVLKILSGLRAVQSQVSGAWRAAAGPRG